MRKLLLSTTLLLVMNITIQAQLNWIVDTHNSQLKFTVVHLMISQIDGMFTSYTGTVKSKDITFADAEINFNVETKSVDTRDADRDIELRSKEFFDCNKFTNMSFKSTSFKKIAGKKYKLIGDLTIKDVTKQVTFDVTFNGTATDGFGNKKAGFKATTTINRLAYGLMWNNTLEGGGLTVSNEVDLILNIQLMMK